MNKDKTRFKYHLENDASMRFFLRKDSWNEYAPSDVTDQILSSSMARIVCYPSGEAMFMYGQMHPVPEGVTFNNGANYLDDRPDYSKNLLQLGEGKVSIQHGDSLSQDEDPRSHYSTSVKNISEGKLRVFKFAAYQKGLFGKLTRESEGFYSPRQFKEWFRVPDQDGWILPNQTVCDPDNFGYANGYWIYFFEDEKGDVFISRITLGRN